MFIYLVFLAIAAAVPIVKESYYVRPLLHKVLSHFEFTVVDKMDTMHFQKFPKSIGQILHKYHVAEFKLSMTSGTWDYNHWDYQFSGGPNGAEFWVKLDTDNRSTSQMDRDWKGVKAEMAAMFSVSLNLLKADRTYSSSMEWTTLEYRRFSKVDDVKGFYYGVLPREEVCTENGTPWLKLLPCRTHAGLGMLIDPLVLAGSDYYSIGIHATRNHTNLSLKQTLTHVVRNDKAIKLKDLWKVKKGKKLVACPVADSSVMYVEGFDKKQFLVKPEKWFKVKNAFHSTSNATDGVIGVYELSKTEPSDLLDMTLMNRPLRNVDRGNVAVQRYFTGHGQVHGGLAVEMVNKHPKNSVLVLHHEHVPWFIKLYFHTLQVRIGNKVLSAPQRDLHYLHVRPAENHGRPNEISLACILKPETSLVFHIDFTKAFLPLEEHPPDANRGEDISSSFTTFHPTNPMQQDTLDGSIIHQRTTPTAPIIIYTPSMLSTMPTPDFSMPYNVITLTSTVLVMFLGGILNVLVRRERKTRLEKAIAQQKGSFFQRIKSRFSSSTKLKVQ